MRPTLARSSEMPGPRVYNLWWGDAGRLRMRGVTQYTISSIQSKAAPHMFRNYLFNGYRRLSEQAVFFLIPFATGYGIYAWGKSYDTFIKSKAGHLAHSEHQ